MDSRQLVIMRHATAGSDGGRDHARTLTARGRDNAHRVGSSLRSRGPNPDRILCSSAIRCRETWDAVAAGLGSTVRADFEDDLYNASPDVLRNRLAELLEEKNVLLLAHNPGVSILALELCRGNAESEAMLRSGFAPASIACFTFEGPWSLLSSSSIHMTRFETAADG
jgi:phosphohistidine phosphatase